MRQKRTRLIVAQSLITAILLGIIALTLLSPEDRDNLFAVGVPRPPGPVVQQPPSYGPEGGTSEDGSPGAEDSDPAGGDAAAAGTAGASGTGTTAPGTVPTVPSPAPPPGDEADGGDGDDDDGSAPPGDQYGDTLARLSDAVD